MANVSLVRNEDVEGIEPLCQRAFEQMGYAKTRGYTYSRQHTIDTIRRGVESDEHMLTKYVKNGQILGFMAIGLTDFSFYSVGKKTAYEIVWHGDPLLSPVQQLIVMKTLLVDMIKRAVAENIDIFSVTIDAKCADISKILMKMGFCEQNRVLVRRLT